MILTSHQGNIEKTCAKSAFRERESTEGTTSAVNNTLNYAVLSSLGARVNVYDDSH